MGNYLFLKIQPKFICIDKLAEIMKLFSKIMILKINLLFKLLELVLMYFLLFTLSYSLFTLFSMIHH